MSGGSRLSCRILSGCRLLLMVSPDVGRVLRLLFRCRGCCSCSPIGCRCSSLSVGRGVAVILSGSVAVALRCQLVGVSVDSDGVPRCREGVAVILSGSVAVALRDQPVGVLLSSCRAVGCFPGRSSLCFCAKCLTCKRLGILRRARPRRVAHIGQTQCGGGGATLSTAVGLRSGMVVRDIQQVSS